MVLRQAVQEGLALNLTFCAYDRSGYGTEKGLVIDRLSWRLTFLFIRLERYEGWITAEHVSVLLLHLPYAVNILTSLIDLQFFHCR